MIIYKLTNKINGKVYIGQTTQPLNRRLKDHFGRYTKCSALSAVIKKYGKHAFVAEVLDELNNVDDLNKAEIDYIKKYNSLCPNGYNLREGGENYRLTENQKVKISNTLKAKKIKPPSRKGSKLSQKHKEQISKKLKGRKKSGKTISKFKKTICKTGTSNKKVFCETDGLCFKSISDAAKYYGFSVSSVWRVCKKEKQYHKNKSFSYIGV